MNKFAILFVVLSACGVQSGLEGQWVSTEDPSGMSVSYRYSIIFFIDGGIDVLNTATYASDSAFMPGCQTTFAFVGDFSDSQGALTLSPKSGTSGAMGCKNSTDNKSTGPIGEAQLGAQTFDYHIDGNRLKLEDQSTHTVTTFTRQ